MTVKEFLAVTKALADESRVRALMSLAGGEMCLCQVIAVLNLAPATVSKHMNQLYAAGLVDRRKEGRWHYYRLAGRNATPLVRQALRFVLGNLAAEPAITADAARCCAAREADRVELTVCYD